MSDGVKNEDGSPNDGGIKRAGRARICKQCKFTTTDVKEFSNHRSHAHAEENSDDKSTVGRKNSLRRKSSNTVVPEEQKPKDQISDAKNKLSTESLTESPVVDNKADIKTESVIAEESEQVISEETMETEDSHVEAKMESEPISNELLNCLLLAPKKPAVAEDRKYPAENGGFEKANREELLRKDDDQDDEPRLVIADDSELGDMDTSGSEQTSLCRSGNIQNRNYLCSECDFTTNSAKEHLRHQKQCHNSELLIYECDICDYATRYKQKLPRHRKLHFSGKDAESYLDSSLSEKELREIHNNTANGEEDMEDDADIYDEDDEDMVNLSSAPEGTPVAPGAPIEKKKRIRQEVDPLKYYEVVDDVGVKYACSKCGNVYKWRKSLNKHWKEKHYGEVPDLTNPPATLQNYTLFSRYKAKYGGQPPPPAAPNVVYGAAQATPANQVKNRSTPTSTISEKDSPSPSPSLSNIVMPRQIGPFIGGTSASMFNSPVPSSLANHMNQRTRTPENHHEVRKLMDNFHKHSAIKLEHKPKLEKDTNQQNQQMEPLDFSKKSDIKSEPIWTDTNSESDSLQDLSLALMVSQANNQIAAAMKQGQDALSELDGSTLRCTKCNFVAKTLVDYSAHMSLHVSKRSFKCAECQAHFNGVEDLNKHFMDCHSEKIQEHKEAIQKLPHGLQQTYHLLKMPLDTISGLSSQELLSNEPKQLKCSMCNFVAKWPAELQKHAVSHSEERPFICMVCASTYKWKWDLVKHFEKSHSSLPNPYKRREGGGVIASPSPANSPATPPMYAMSKNAIALIDPGMMNLNTNYILQDEVPPAKKRRLSDNDMQDEESYRELLEKQILQRRDMAQSSLTPTGIKIHSQNKGAYSEPLMKTSEYKQERLAMEERENIENHTPKRNVHEALKQRLHSGKVHEETSPAKEVNGKGTGKSEVMLPYKCSVCEYRARWPSEISQHMKNHSTEKPFHCPRCSYKSKWKWDVVKHLRRCGGGTVHDVIDTSKLKKMAPPNVTVLPQGGQQQQPSPQQHSMHLPILQKTSPNQPVFPGMSGSATNSPGNKSATNFTMAVGGQDHPEDSQGQSYIQVNGNKHAVFRSVVNQGIHHCLECPFVANNATELRRHAMLHSENKPFSCNMCGYNTRWKCDLKKHMKTYGHFNNSPDSGDDVDNSTEQSMEGDDESDEENKSTLYMCPQCPYNSYKKNAFDLHLRVHGSVMEEQNMSALASSNASSAKYRCSKCSYKGNDLSSFLQHKRSHNMKHEDGSSRTSTPVPGEVSSRTVHLKNRRKPVKQFCCDRCPFVCFTKNSLDVHAAMHIPRGSDTYLCMFCDYNVFSKTLLLQHMRLHPEYNPAECSEADGKVTAIEIMEMEELEEREINGDDTKSTGTEENNNVDGYESAFENSDALDFSKVSTSVEDSRSSTTSEENKSSVSANNNNIIVNNNNTKTSGGNGMNLPCEWCYATFPNVVALYQHSQSQHPNQLKAQEAGDIAARQAPTKGSQLEQIVKERQREYQVYHQFMAHQQPQIQIQIQNQLQSQATQQQQSLVKKFIPLAPKPEPTTQESNQDMSSSHGQLSPHQIAAMKARKSASIQKKSRSFQCTKCSFTAPNAVTYLRHIEHHGSNCKHTCRYCDYSIDRLNLLYQHMKGTHPDKWQGTLEEKITLSVHSEDSNNNIIEAGDENQASDELNNSLNSSQNESLEIDPAQLSQLHGQQKYKCKQCDFGADNIKQLQQHLEGHAKEANLGNSSRNTVLIDDFPDINNHGEVPSMSHTSYTCTKCPYKTRESLKLKIHMTQHSCNGKYECQLCDYSADQYNFLKLHAKLHNTRFMQYSQAMDADINNDEQSYEETEYARQCGLETKRKRVQEIRFKCSCCPFFTTNKSSIMSHRFSHINKGPYACQQCSFSTKHSVHFEEHIRFHEISPSSDEKYINIDVDPFSEINDQIGDKLDDDEEVVEDDDDEVALMEAELKDTIDDIEGDRTVERNLNAEGVFGGDIQFRNYKCQECPFSSNSHAEFKKHCGLHGSNYKFKCDFCSYSLDRVNLISQHRRLHFQEEDFDTAPLMAKLLNKNHPEYDTMLTKVGKELAFPPSEGSVKTLTETADLYLSHKTPDEKARYSCSSCPYRCQALKSFKVHLQMHGLNQKYKCDYCDWSTDRLNLICQHRRVHSHEKDFEQTPGDITFLNREYVLDGQNSGEGNVNVPEYHESPYANEDLLIAQSPKKTGLGEKIHYCKLCPFKTENANTYSYHKKFHCIQARYRCSECSYSINNVASLQEHIKLHEKDREMIKASVNETGVRHKCPKCPFSCPNKFLLVAHTSMHSSERKYSCTQCDFSTDKQMLLQLHLKVHNKSYTESDSLEEMELMMKRTPDVIGPQLFLSSSNHNEFDSDSSDGTDPDFKCEKCPFSTGSKDMLSEHMQLHDTPGKVKCMYCSYSCSKEDDLLTHIQVHFPSTSVDRDMLKMLRKQSSSHKRKFGTAFDDSDAEKSENQFKGINEEPDSTMSEIHKEVTSENMDVSFEKPETVRESEKMKVYVCQYCEREFDDKSNMVIHEKQHLVG